MRALESGEAMPGKANYLVGNDSSKWLRGVSRHKSVRQREVYPGIDLVYHGADLTQLEYDFELSPGADPSAIKIGVTGADALAISEDGSLAIRTPAGTIVQRPPVAYQEDSAGRRVPVAASYVVRGRTIRFKVSPYDRKRALVIDPVVSYLATLGSVSQADASLDVAVDSQGSAYLTGYTQSIDFPTTPGAHDTTLSGAQDVYVTKFSPDGSAIEYSTFIGGSTSPSGFLGEQGHGIAVDASGAAYVTGVTSMSDFPVVNAFQPSYGGEDRDAFLLRLSPDGGSLMYSSYLGGTGSEEGRDVVVDSGGSAYASGLTYSPNFPTLNPFQSTLGGGSGTSIDAFVTKVDSQGALVYSTYLGGLSVESGEGIAVDASGSVVLAGFSASGPYSGGSGDPPFFPILNPFQAENAGSLDCFVTEFTPAGNALVSSTFLGGIDADQCNAIALDAAGAPHVVGRTASANFPLSAPLQATRRGREDAFITKFSPDGMSLSYSTYLGGAAGGNPSFGFGTDVGEGIALDASGNACVVGTTNSTDFPTHRPFVATYQGGLWDAFVAKINASGSALKYASYIGSAGGGDAGFGIATDAQGNAYPAGFLAGDAFVAKILQIETTITSGPPAATTEPVATFTFESSEDGSSFECSLDGAPFSACSSPASTGPLADGAHQFEVRATDTEGNTDSTPAVRNWVLDRTAPETTITAGPSGATSDSTPEFQFTSNESPNVSFECSVDGGSFSACTSPHEVTPAVAAGAHTFDVRAIDLAGNVDPTPASRSFSVDTSEPQTTLTSVPPADTNESTASFEFTSDDPGASFECRLVPAAFAVCVSPTTVGPLADGTNTFEVRAADQAGNRDSTPASWLFRVDTVSPVLVLVSPAESSSHSSTPIDVTVQASESVVVTGSSVFASGTPLPAGNTTTSVALSSGYNSFSTFVRDAAGNSALLVFSFFLDQTPPELVFLSPAPGAGLYYSPAQVLVSLSEDVTVTASSPGFLALGALAGGERTLTLPLSSGSNTFTASFADRAGNPGSFSGSLTLDTARPPPPSITFPSNGAVLTARSVVVSGTATGNATQVRVAGATSVTVPVSGGIWSGTVNLVPGLNRIRAVALSAAGLVSPEVSVSVRVQADRTIVAQSGRVQVVKLLTLSAPLVAKVTDGAGMPVASATVTFRIVAEPASGNAQFTNALKTITTSTTAAGEATIQVRTGTGWDDPAGSGYLQAIIVEATVPALRSAPAEFSVQPFPACNLDPASCALPPAGNIAYLLQLGTDCGAFTPFGECPSGAVDTDVSGFAVFALDAQFKAAVGKTVEFAVRSGSQGNFAGSPTVSVIVIVGVGGVARSGPFRLGTQVGAPPGTPGNDPESPDSFRVLLNPADASSTRVRMHLALARTPGGGVTISQCNAGQMNGCLAAFAYAGPPALISDVSTANNGNNPGMTAQDPLLVRVTDAFMNPVANASATFTGLIVSPDLGPRVFRATPDFSTSDECGFEMATLTDSCAATAISATTFEDGDTWAQMILGKRAGAPYQVAVSSGDATPATITRFSRLVFITGPGDPQYTPQVSYSATALFAITDTENDDTDPVHGVVWKITCDDADGNNLCDGTYTTVRDTGRTINFSSTADATFSPPSPTMGVQTSVDGGGRVPVTQPEVAAFLVGGPDPASLTHTFSVTINPTYSLQVGGAQASPTILAETPRVTLACAEFPSMSPRGICDPPFLDSSFCRVDEAGVSAYIDRGNGYTENVAVALRVLHPGSSPVPFRLVKKSEETIIISGNEVDVGTPVNYYGLVPGSPGTPGLFGFSGTPVARLPDGRFSLKFSTAVEGCRDFVAKSYQRNAVPTTPEEDLPAADPPDPRLLVRLEDETPIVSLLLPGWVDEIARARGSSPNGTLGSDAVVDWLEMRAWDFLENPTVLTGPVVQSVEGDKGLIARTKAVPPVTLPNVLPEEPSDVFGQVNFIGASPIPMTIRSRDFLARTLINFQQNETGDTGWTVGTTIRYNIAHPTIRTDAQHWESIDQGDITFTPIHTFFHATAHESRHVWQNRLLIRTGPGFPEQESAANRNPNNNDDFLFYDASGQPLIDPSTAGTLIYDCLPERALLNLDDADPINDIDVGGAGGSAQVLIDTTANVEFGLGIHGETPGGQLESEDVDACIRPDARATRLRERDATRFARTLEDEE